MERTIAGDIEKFANEYFEKAKTYKVYFDIYANKTHWTESAEVKAKNQKDAKMIVKKYIKETQNRHTFHMRFVPEGPDTTDIIKKGKVDISLFKKAGQSGLAKWLYDMKVIKEAHR